MFKAKMSFLNFEYIIKKEEDRYNLYRSSFINTAKLFLHA